MERSRPHGHTDDSPEEKMALAGRAIRSHDVKLVSDVLNLLCDTSARVRSAAALALGSLADASAISCLLDRLHRDENEVVRACCVIALQGSDGRDVRDGLLASLVDPSEKVREMAASVLSEIGEQRAVKPLMAMLQHPTWQARLTAVESLIKLGRGGPTIIAAIETLRSEPDAVRLLAQRRELLDDLRCDPETETSISTSGLADIRDIDHLYARASELGE